MTMLSPKAWRFVHLAFREMGAKGRETWDLLDRDPAHELPPEAAEAVLSALGDFERSLRANLASGRLTEDETSDVSNDLGFVCAIEQDLSRGLRRRA